MAVYPRHSSEVGGRRDRPEDQPDFWPRAWLLGQLVCAEAALDLLAHRAGAALKKQKPWPE